MMPRKEARRFQSKIWGSTDIKTYPRIVHLNIIDNVVDTGNTAKAAIRALGSGTVASFAMSDTLLQREETRTLRR